MRDERDGQFPQQHKVLRQRCDPQGEGEKNSEERCAGEVETTGTLDTGEHLFFDLKCGKVLLKMPTIATLIFSIRRADRKSTSGLQRHCLLTPYRFRWMQDLTGF